MGKVLRAAAGGVLLLALSAARSPASCPGDCNGDGVLRLTEFELALSAVFDPPRCPAADADRNGSVGAADLLAVWRALAAPACAPATASPSPTATPTPTVLATPASTWIPLAPLPGGPRQEVGVAALAGRVFVVGGLTDTGAGSAAVEVYDPSGGGDWSRAADLPRALHHIGVAVLDGALYAVGGYVGQTFVPAGDVSRYDPDTNEWIARAPLPAARGALAAAALAGQLHAVGGAGASGSVAEHIVYDPQANAWSPRAALPTGRNHLAAVTLGERLYVIGGRRDGAGNQNSAELDRYDSALDAWDVLTPMPTARSGHAAAVLDGRIVVMGGEVNTANPPSRVFVEVEVYDPGTNAWTQLDPMALARHGIGAATVGELIYVPGGATRAGFAATDWADALRIF